MLTVAMIVYYAAGAVALLVLAERAVRAHSRKKAEQILCRRCAYCERFYESPLPWFIQAYCQQNSCWMEGKFPDDCRSFREAKDHADI